MSNLRDFIFGGDINRYLEVDCTGLSVKTIDAKLYDTFHFTGVTQSVAVTLSSMPNGKSITICVVDGGYGITFVDTILWPGGEAPDFDGAMTMIVITKLGTIYVGGFAGDLR